MLLPITGNESKIDRCYGANSTTNSSSKDISNVNNDNNMSFTQKLTVPALQQNDIESELAVPLKDSEDTDIEPPLKKKCSMEMVATSQSLGEPSNKATPAITRLKSSCSTPLASKSFIANLSTPDTPYGQIFCDQPVTPETKKRWKKYVLNSIYWK